jgi:hypothetical protein
LKTILMTLAAGLLWTAPAFAADAPPSADEAFVESANGTCFIDARDADLAALAADRGLPKAEAAAVPLKGARNVWSIPVHGGGRVYLSTPVTGDAKESECVVTAYGVDLASVTGKVRAWWGESRPSTGADGQAVETFSSPTGGVLTLETWSNAGPDRANAQTTYRSGR